MAVVAVVIVMAVVVVIVVVIAMVFAAPVALMSLPALPVVVVVGMIPVGAGVGWLLPCAGYPDIVPAANSPVAVDPDEAFCRHGRRDFIADWWRGAYIDLDLAECRYCQSRCGDDTV